MTTSSGRQFLSTLLPKERAPDFVLGYLRSSFIGRLHDAVLSVFLELERRKEISKAELARRLNKEPAQITRWLSGPGNWEMGTVSDLAAAMGYEPEVRLVPIKTKADESFTGGTTLANRQAQNDSGHPQDLPPIEKPERDRLQRMYG